MTPAFVSVNNVTTLNNCFWHSENIKSQTWNKNSVISDFKGVNPLKNNEMDLILTDPSLSFVTIFLFVFTEKSPKTVKNDLKMTWISVTL